MDYSRWSKRAAGYLIDWAAAFIPSALGGLIAFVLHDDDGKTTPTGQLINALFGFVSLGIVVYNRWIQGGRTGQTWGRRALGIRMVDQRSRQPIGFGRSLMRDICHILDSITFFLGWLFPLWDNRKQTFADKIVNTVVINQP